MPVSIESYALTVPWVENSQYVFLDSSRSGTSGKEANSAELARGVGQCYQMIKCARLDSIPKPDCLDTAIVPSCIVAACCFAVTTCLSANSLYSRCLNSLSHEIHIVGIQNRNAACAHLVQYEASSGQVG